MIYELLTGNFPFEREAMIVSGEPPKLDHVDIDPKLIEILSWML